MVKFDPWSGHWFGGGGKGGGVGTSTEGNAQEGADRGEKERERGGGEREGARRERDGRPHLPNVHIWQRQRSIPKLDEADFGAAEEENGEEEDDQGAEAGKLESRLVLTAKWDVCGVCMRLLPLGVCSVECVV
jgi:hypothetical protein